MLSIVMICLNEENNLRALLPHLTFCNEIIVVDSGSTDKSGEVVAQYGGRFIYHQFNGYGEQKRFAVSLAKNDWILNLDADEIPSEDLIKNICNIVKDSSSKDAYRINIVDIFLGTPIIRWGGKGAEHIRLFKKSVVNFSNELVHERVEYNQSASCLDGYVAHRSYRDIDHYMNKFNLYTTKAGALKGRVLSSPIRILLRMTFKFFDFYFIKGYLRSGYAGFVWCLFSSFYVVAKLIKGREMLSPQVYQELNSKGLC